HEEEPSQRPRSPRGQEVLRALQHAPGAPRDALNQTFRDDPRAHPARGSSASASLGSDVSGVADGVSTPHTSLPALPRRPASVAAMDLSEVTTLRLGGPARSVVEAT